MSTLNILSQELIKIETHIAESEGELSAQQEHELEQINKDLMEKIDSYSYRLDKLSLAANYWKEKSKESSEISKRIFDHIDRMEKTIEINMSLMGKREICGESTRFYLRKSPKPTVVIEDSSLVPREFVTQNITVKADKEAIAQALKMGQTVSGCKLEVREFLAKGPTKKET